MKRQSRPFIVEVKKKRGDSARQRSIWGNLDLAAIDAETARELTKIKSDVSCYGESSGGSRRSSIIALAFSTAAIAFGSQRSNSTLERPIGWDGSGSRRLGRSGTAEDEDLVRVGLEQH
ncbi:MULTISPECIES: hypothetical protein [unclassified Mesorhizobium]|uniref:hypothetical protein n=1 Tax=unclassified Mesorhizobium TaxID=325217 RepID=UPI003338AD8A